jgi:hypothetical protein
MPLTPSGAFWVGNTSAVNLGAGCQQNKYKLDVDIFNMSEARSLKVTRKK